MSAHRRFAGQSEFVRVRDLRYHLRRWGDPRLPPVFLLHGWLDVSATWAPVVHAMGDIHVLAPDWRGFGHTQWPQDGYWFHDYVADLEALLEVYAGDGPVALVGHSMGGQIASLYAGLRPQRVQTLILVDSLFLPDMGAELAPKRFRAWLDQLRNPPGLGSYASFEDLAQRIQRRHPVLTPERAHFIATCWGREDGRGRITLCADPKHRLHGPGTHRAAESMAIWKEVTARTLFIDGGESIFGKAIPIEEIRRRRACFRNHQVARIDGAGHMVHFDAPEILGRRIADFLTEQSCS